MFFSVDIIHWNWKYTFHFHQKVSQKHIEIKIQSLKQGLPGIAQMKLLTGSFEAEPLLAHWIQVVAPLMANRTCAVPGIDPKHKGERKIKLEIDRIKEKIDGLIVKKSIKRRTN